MEETTLENNKQTTKFILHEPPFKLKQNNNNILTENKNITNKYSQKLVESPKTGICSVLSN